MQQNSSFKVVFIISCALTQGHTTAQHCCVSSAAVKHPSDTHTHTHTYVSSMQCNRAQQRRGSADGWTGASVDSQMHDHIPRSPSPALFKHTSGRMGSARSVCKGLSVRCQHLICIWHFQFFLAPKKLAALLVFHNASIWELCVEWSRSNLLPATCIFINYSLVSKSIIEAEYENANERSFTYFSLLECH